jgi:hypothetical protein
LATAIDAKRFELDCGPNFNANAFSRNAEACLNFEAEIFEDDDDVESCTGEVEEDGADEDDDEEIGVLEEEDEDDGTTSEGGRGVS